MPRTDSLAFTLRQANSDSGSVSALLHSYSRSAGGSRSASAPPQGSNNQGVFISPPIRGWHQDTALVGAPAERPSDAVQNFGQQDNLNRLNRVASHRMHRHPWLAATAHD